jgi:hypothetical protein
LACRPIRELALISQIGDPRLFQFMLFLELFDQWCQSRSQVPTSIASRVDSPWRQTITSPWISPSKRRANPITGPFSLKSDERVRSLQALTMQVEIDTLNSPPEQIVRPRVERSSRDPIAVIH